MNILRRAALPALLVLSLCGLAAFTVREATAQPGPERPHRVFIPMAARDGVVSQPEPGGPLPPADPSYCPGSTGGAAPPSPPNSVIGLLTIGGQPAPRGTIVQIAFDGKAGPAERTREAGGYRIDYAAGGAQCANKVGAAIAIIVNGQAMPTGVKVGDAVANPFLRFDIAIP